jgi:uncharacterized protein (TIGR03067 family)
MHRVSLLALAAGFALLGASAVADEKADEKALKGLEGTYVIVGFEAKGLKLGEEELKKLGKDEERLVTIKGDRITAKLGGMEDPATFKLDASKDPPRIDITKNRDCKKERNYGIYKLDKDVLTICATEMAGPEDRPTAFKAGDKTILIVLRKRK